MKDSSRNQIIDIAKGIGILLVVYGHCGLPFSGSLILYFHMPLFFFLSGWTFKENDTVKDFIVKRIRRLYLPFVLINAFFLFLNPILFAMGFEKNMFGFTEILTNAAKIISFQNCEPIVSQCWYLLGLFSVSILFKIIHSIVGKKVLVIVYTFLAVLGIIMVHSDIRFQYGNCDLLNVVLISSVFFMAGYLVKYAINKNISLKPVKCIVGGGLITLFFLICKYKFHYESDFRSNMFTSVFLIYPAAFLGIFLVFLVSKVIRENRIKSVFTFFGRNTMPIFLLHTIGFKIIDLFMVKNFGFNKLLYGWGHVNGGLAWNFVHFVAGIALPLFFVIITKKITTKLYSVNLGNDNDKDLSKNEKLKY